MLGFEAGALQLALLSATTELGLSGAGMGLPVTVQFLSLSFMPLLFGPVADRTGKKKIVLAFMVVFIAGCLITWLCATSAQFLIGLFIVGAGFSLCESMTTAALSDAFKEKGEKNINIAQTFFCIGAVGSPLLMQALIDGFSASWRVGFLIIAITMIAIIPVLSFAKFTPAVAVTKKEAEKKSKHPFLLFGLILCMFIYAGSESGIAFFADTVFTIGLDRPVWGAFAISLFWGFMGIGRFFFGRMKRIPPNATAVSLFAGTALILVMMVCRHDVAMLVLYAAAGLAMACVWPGIVNATVAIDLSASGRIMSYLTLGGGLGCSLVPLAIGALINTGGIPVAFLVLALVTVAAAVYMWVNRHAIQSFRLDNM